MSGKLVGLVIEHGPKDHAEWAVLVVVAEDMHHPGDSALLSLEELAARTRLDRATVARAVKRLRHVGWVDYTPGGGRGRASRYRLNPDANVWAGVGLSTGPETVAECDPLPAEKPSQSATLSTLNRRTEGPKPSHHATPHRNRKNTIINGAADDPLPVVVGVASLDDDVARESLHGIRGAVPTPAIRRALGVALHERGHTAVTVNAHLRAAMAGNVLNPTGLALDLIRDIPPYVEPVRREPCTACDDTGWVDPEADRLERCPSCFAASRPFTEPVELADGTVLVPPSSGVYNLRIGGVG